MYSLFFSEKECEKNYIHNIPYSHTLSNTYNNAYLPPPPPAKKFPHIGVRIAIYVARERYF